MKRSKAPAPEKKGAMVWLRELIGKALLAEGRVPRPHMRSRKEREANYLRQRRRAMRRITRAKRP